MKGATERTSEKSKLHGLFVKRGRGIPIKGNFYAGFHGE